MGVLYSSRGTPSSYSRWRRASLFLLHTAPRTILFGGRLRFISSTGVFLSGTFPLRQGPTDHRLPNPVGPRILRFYSPAAIIKSPASSAWRVARWRRTTFYKPCLRSLPAPPLGRKKGPPEIPAGRSFGAGGRERPPSRERVPISSSHTSGCRWRPPRR
jgi:hypothetical protein